MYPEYVEINGKYYKIDTDFNVALKCFEVIEDESITDYERSLAIVYLLFGEAIDSEIIDNPKKFMPFLEKAKLYLQCGKDLKEQKQTKRDMDFQQDKSFIMSSFMSDYHIDLSKEKLHFWQYIDLIEGLTNECSLNRVRDIRNYDLSNEKDAKRRKEIIEAKKQVALKPEKKKHTKSQKEMANKIYEKLGLKRR